MNRGLFSTKWIQFRTFRQKVLFWGIFLLLASWNYYTDFFAVMESLLWGTVLTLQVVGMVLVGYASLSKYKRFPTSYFLGWTMAFTMSRFLVVFFVLQDHLPEWTVFHDPVRSTPFLAFTSAMFLFLGYSYSIYEWGLAAREEYKKLTGDRPSDYAHPILIKAEGSLVRLLPQDILYIEARGEYINYVTQVKSYLVFQRLKKAEEELEEYGFRRAHRSYILNTMNIRSIAVQEAIMVNEDRIPISKTYKEAVAKAFHRQS